ncbi:hypothetical protein M9H77_36460 [Catharanthus roseus]|uniref:Uncharacterized protein n=1 Tax=Catharanthus roseus TaxID=4058 RepID=A0ACB9ZVL3_CATRO|nr:hypothetical protein M9H77_36460 [Catharanthus roseus]
MCRSRAPYRCGLFKMIYSFCEAGVGYTQTAEGVAQSAYVDTASFSTVGFDHLVVSQEGFEIEVGPRADLVGAPGCGCLVIESSYGVWLVLTTRCQNLVPMTSFWDPDFLIGAQLWHYFPAALETLMSFQASVLLK